MKNTIAILLMMISIQANAFNYLLKDKNIEKPHVSLNIQQQIVENEMSVDDFLQIKEIATSNSLFKIVSYEVFVLPSKGVNPFEFYVNQNNLAFFQESRVTNLSSFQKGTKIFFDKIKVVDEKGNEFELNPVVFKLK